MLKIYHFWRFTMKTKISILALIFVLALSVVFTASCGDSGNVPSDTPDTTAAAGEDTTAGEEIPEAEMTREQLVEKKIAELPKEKYGGDEFNFFVRSSNFHSVWKSIEIYAEEETNETLNDAVYIRNRKLEELYDILISESGCSGKDFLAELRTLILSGDDSFEVIVPNLRDASTLAGEELIYDLNDIPNLDLTSPWWDQQVTKQLSINNAQFFTLGDISYIDKLATRGIFFNKGLITDFNLESPYELVEKNEWTADKFYEMMKVVAADIDSDGQMTELDRFGLVGENNTLNNMMIAMGGTEAELDADGMPVATFMEDKTQNALNKIFQIYFDRDVSYNDGSILYKKSGKSDDTSRGGIWKACRALFFEIGFNNLETYRNYEFDFGIVPVPKADPDMDFHASFYVLGPAAFAIPITNTDLERTGTILEAMGAYSSITLRPAYYETAIQGKYTRDEESVAMLDIIFASRVYDIGMINNIGGLDGKISTLAAACSTNVASMYAKIEGKIADDIQTIIDTYSK